MYPRLHLIEPFSGAFLGLLGDIRILDSGLEAAGDVVGILVLVIVDIGSYIRINLAVFFI